MRTKKTSGARFSHLRDDGSVAMVDVSGKPVSVRDASAAGKIRLAGETMRLIEANRIAKGNVLATAQIAGIQAAKRTAELIPLCHPLHVSRIEVEFVSERDGIAITSSVRTTGQTGAEMEALTAVAVAALTIYDMCKAVDKKMVITQVRLLSKTKREVGSK